MKKVTRNATKQFFTKYNRIYFSAKQNKRFESSNLNVCLPHLTSKHLELVQQVYNEENRLDISFASVMFLTLDDVYTAMKTKLYDGYDKEIQIMSAEVLCIIGKYVKGEL